MIRSSYVRQFQRAFADFAFDYVRSVNDTLFGGGGTQNAANRPDFDAQVASALVSLQDDLTTMLGLSPRSADTLIPQVEQLASGSDAGSLGSRLIALSSPADVTGQSSQLLGAYAAQSQIMPLDDLIKKTNYDLGQFSVGVNSWKYKDGKQYGIPLDWAGAAIYFNKDMVKAETKEKSAHAKEETKEKTGAATEATSDAGVTAAVKSKLLGDTKVSGLAIDVDTKDNVVTLSGKVHSATEKNEAVRLAKGTHGVKRVVDNLTIQPK